MMNSLSSVDSTQIIVIAVCLVLSAFFSGSETAITSLGTLKAKHLIKSKGGSVKQLSLWVEHPGRVITTILIFNNVVNILGSVLAADLATRYFEDQAIGIATGVMTFLVLIFGEIIPKSFAKANSQRLAIATLKIIGLIYRLFFPLVWVLSEFAAFTIKLLGGEPNKGPPITEDEIEFLIGVGEREGVLEETKREMLEGVFDFDETRVREIMTPRTDMMAIDLSDSYEDAMTMVIETGHSRIPVYDEEGIDHIVGVILAKDLLKAGHNGNRGNVVKISDLKREAFFVPETKLIMEVFKELKRNKNHIAIVIDEYGGTAGLVTMEDLLEEIVGEIQDEYDSEEAELLEIEPGVYDVSGSVNVEDFLEFFDLQDEKIKEEREPDIDTIGGWIIQLIGRMPKVGETAKIGPLDIEIQEVDRHRIMRVRVTHILPEEESEEAE